MHLEVTPGLYITNVTHTTKVLVTQRHMNEYQSTALTRRSNQIL